MHTYPVGVHPGVARPTANLRTCPDPVPGRSGGPERPKPRVFLGLRVARVWPPAAVLQGAARVQPSPGLKDVMDFSACSVLGPKSFWKTTPSWLTMKVMTPEFP